MGVAVFRTFKSSVSWQATSAMGKEIWDRLADLSSVALNIGWKQSSLAEWVYMAMKPSLWIHAWRHLTAASEEEHKVNVERAKRAFAAKTLFAPTHHGTVPETAATCEDSMAPEDDHPEIELMHEGEAEEADADGDVEDIVMEVPVQPAASATSSSAAPAKNLRALSGALRSTSSSARAPAAVSSRRRFELNCLCMLWRNCLMLDVWRLIQSLRFTGFRRGSDVARCFHIICAVKKDFLLWCRSISPFHGGVVFSRVLLCSCDSSTTTLTAHWSSSPTKSLDPS